LAQREIRWSHMIENKAEHKMYKMRVVGPAVKIVEK
jgi:hypothetical protein